MKYVDVPYGYGFQRVITIAEIQKTLIEGKVYIKKRFGDNCTLRKLQKRLQNIEKKYKIGISIPFYVFYALIESKMLEKEKRLLQDLIKIYKFSYCLMSGDAGDYYRPRFDELGEKIMASELLDRNVDLDIFFGWGFEKEYGAYLTFPFDYFRPGVKADYIELEEKAAKIERQNEENKNNKHRIK